jgi:hypothetical protein
MSKREQPPPQDDDLDSICDCCSQPVMSSETQAGPAGTEWETANVCNDCYAELLDESSQ